VASCLACASHRHQVQIPAEQVYIRPLAESSSRVQRSGVGATLARDASKTLTKLLLASHPAASFTPVNAMFGPTKHLRTASSKQLHGDRRQGTSMSEKKLQLKYFDARGVAEPARIMFALAGEEYEDARYEIKPGPPMEVPGFKADKEAGALKMNLGRAPILILEDGISFGQSKAIERFLAKRFGFMGQNPTEEALIDSIAEHCRDVTDAKNRKGFGPFTRNKTEEEKTAARNEWFSTDLPSFLERIETVVAETGSPGFAVGSSRSLADVCIFSLLKDCSPADTEDVAKAAEKCSALMAIADGVYSQEPVAKWLEERPKTMM